MAYEIVEWGESHMKITVKLPDDKELIYLVQINGHTELMLWVPERFTIEEIEKAARDAVKDELKGRHAKAVIVLGHFVNFIVDGESAMKVTTHYLLQIDGKPAGNMAIIGDFSTDEIKYAARESIASELKGREARAVVVPGKLVNFIVDDGPGEDDESR